MVLTPFQRCFGLGFGGVLGGFAHILIHCFNYISYVFAQVHLQLCI